MNPILFLSLGVVCFILMTAIHEYGHYLVALKKNMNPKMVFGLFPPELGVRFDDTNRKDTVAVYLIGIIFGAVVIYVFTFIHIFYIMMAIPYAFGIQSDAKELWNLRK